ncbi:hypothetical protein [Vibrio parahaemolyticus]|uniref:hypothetical protein n=1 Tax=Vibrio parahaemolyticus TaxID=670 RepID=UPI0021522442|nr:hypothetical protein [Vibrio parahaemolyticus]
MSKGEMMAANGAIYIQRDNVDLKDVFDDVTSDKGIFRKPTYYDVKLGEDVVRFNIMESSEIPNHIDDFLGYIASLNNSDDRKEKTSYAISHTKVVLGLVSDTDFEDNHKIWQSLFRIADKYDGFVFVYDSVLLPNGAALVGPLVQTDT